MSLLDLQDFSKGIEKKNTKSTTDGQEIIGRENRAENTPAQKNKDIQRDAKSWANRNRQVAHNF